MIELALFIYLAPLIFMLLIGEDFDLKKLLLYHAIILTVFVPAIFVGVGIYFDLSKPVTAVLAGSIAMGGLAWLINLSK